MQPMEFAFQDSVSAELVWYWRDTLGRRWLATSAWALFRVRPNPPVWPDISWDEAQIRREW